jgi:hypothetical protein
MTKTNRCVTLAAAAVCAALGGAGRALAQAEVTPWGSVPGIRVEGERMPLAASVCAVGADGAVVARTARERQRPRFSRDATGHTVTSSLGALSFVEGVEDTGPGAARIDLSFTADSASAAGGSLCLDLPRAEFGAASVQLIGSPSSRRVALAAPAGGAEREYLRATARGVRLVSPGRTLEIRFGEPAAVVVRPARRQGADEIAVTIAVLPAGAAAGSTARNRFAVTTSRPVDHGPVEISLDASRPGRVFDGLGGNFRIQNPRTDPPVVAYNLAKLRVAWGRVELPWRDWDPDEGADPTAAAEAGHLNPRLTRALEMAHELGRRKIPVIVSAWFPPAWAVVGELHDQPVNGVWGNQLNPEKMERIYASITSYLLFLKSHYGVEPALFSFNESDLGINVRQTPQEHDALIRGLGAYLAAHGLATKMLLGDTSDATATDFIGAAMSDTAAWPYIGAVSFHSWRGWGDDLLTFWRDAARKLHVPLLVGEGSTDAAAWNYPAVFQEPWFAMEEINLYTRMLAISQPKSILQWQLTADYSVLAGGGVFGDTTALRPTQRFWNLKQFASVPAGAFHLPVSCSRPDVTCAALGDIANGRYAIHLVNNGASHPATLRGLPHGVKELRVYVTDATREMEEGPPIPVVNGSASFVLGPTSFTTIVATS